MDPSLRSLALSLLALALFGCSDDYGEECSLPDSPAFESLCGDVASAEGAVQTCVFTNSPDCSSRMCVQFAGQPGYCSEGCDASNTASCGADSVCLVIPTRTDGYCVPLSVIDAAQ